MKKILSSLCVCACAFASAQISFSLASGSPITAPTNMKCILSRDLNNDGNMDLLTSTAYGSAISAFTGNGNGQFVANSTYNVAGNGPIFMALADFNGDTKQDMAVANYNNNDISVLLAATAGGFTASATPSYTLGNQPYCVDVADFNMDGRMDIIACSANGYNVSMWFGNGAGSFTVAPSFPIFTPPLPYYVCAGFFNQDAFPDFAYVTGLGNLLYVYINNGSGSFTGATGSPYATGTEPRTISAKDLNNDGFTDLVVPNASSNDVSVFMGSASGAFTAASGSPISLGTYPYQAAIADYDLNGTQDLAITCANVNQLYLLSGNGTGGFSGAGSPISVGNMPQSIVTDDFNADGKPDLALADWYGTGVNVFLNTNTVCPVSAGFTYTNSGNGLVNFYDSSTGTSGATTYAWNFGDNSSGTGAITSHTYANGTYTVTLTVSNSSLCVDTYTQVVSVCAIAPTFTYSVLANGQVNFFNTSTGAGTAAVCTWSYGDNTTGTGFNSSHNYSTGTYTVTLNITDTPGCTRSVSQVITIEVITGLSESSPQSLAYVYPNPAKSKLNIDLAGLNTAQKTRFIAYAVTGSQVLNLELDAVKTSVTVSHLPAGLYFYKLVQGENSIKQGRIVIEK